jgi:hypothetical protein
MMASPLVPSRRRLLAAGGALLGSAIVPAIARANDSWAAVVLPQARQRDIASPLTGQRYRIFTSVPDTPPPAAGHPVLYALDGNASFPLLAQMARSAARRAKATGQAAGSRDAVLAQRRMVGEARDLSVKLGAMQGAVARTQFFLFAQENHGSAAFPAMARGMEFFIG